MFKDHLIGTQDIEKVCSYCGQTLNSEWCSLFEGEKHYKIIVCNCGKKHKQTMCFDGSGHDTWKKKQDEENIRPLKTLENKIKELKRLN